MKAREAEELAKVLRREIAGESKGTGTTISVRVGKFETHNYMCNIHIRPLGYAVNAWELAALTLRLYDILNNLQKAKKMFDLFYGHYQNYWNRPEVIIKVLRIAKDGNATKTAK